MAAGDPVGDLAPPVVAELDLVLVKPDIVPTHFEVGLDTLDEFLIGVVAVAEEDTMRFHWVCLHILLFFNVFIFQFGKEMVRFRAEFR